MRSRTFNPGSKLRVYFIALLLTLVTACSGGIGAVLLLVEGGISGTGISFGSIAAFSSVFVNGTKLEIDSGTEIYVDETLATETDLKVGYVIRVEADFDNSTAKRIDYVESVRGPLTAIPLINPDTFAGSFDVLGQTISTNSATIFDGIADVTALVMGDILDISGVRNSTGAIVARYVQLKTSPVSEYRVVGEIANTNPILETFFVGNLEINYTGADISGLIGGIVEDGIEVRVKGPAASFNLATPSINADIINDSALILGIQSGDSVELEGAVTRFVSISDMDVNGFPVDASAAVIEDGDINDIITDALLEVEGSVDSTNVLNASKVKILPVDNIRIDANVDSVDLVNNTIQVLGRNFQLTEKTQLEDNSSAQIVQFSLLDLSPGDWVELRGYSQDGIYYLSRLEREDPDTDVRLQAPVDENGVDPVNKTIGLLGITVMTDSIGGITSYEDINNMQITEPVFFNSVVDGDLVKARWKAFMDISLPVDELSIE